MWMFRETDRLPNFKDVARGVALVALSTGLAFTGARPASSFEAAGPAPEGPIQAQGFCDRQNYNPTYRLSIINQGDLEMSNLGVASVVTDLDSGRVVVAGVENNVNNLNTEAPISNTYSGEIPNSGGELNVDEFLVDGEDVMGSDSPLSLRGGQRLRIDAREVLAASSTSNEMGNAPYVSLMLGDKLDSKDVTMPNCD